jgi:hypothetical protein
MTSSQRTQGYELDICPHSDDTYIHAWHGLPHTGCGGSHLPLDEAKVQAKPDLGKPEETQLPAWRGRWNFLR